MKIKGVSQAELARQINVSKALIGYYLTGKRFPSAMTAYRIFVLTGIPIIKLLSIEERGRGQ